MYCLANINNWMSNYFLQKKDVNSLVSIVGIYNHTES